VALEQHQAKLALQRLDLAAEGGLGLAERPGGSRKRAFLGGDEEGAGAVPVEGDGSPIHALMHITQAISVNSI
jgi:hypothetical protein